MLLVGVGEADKLDAARYARACTEAGKALRIGERQVAAEVLSRGNDGWVRLIVRACTITKDEFGGRTVTVLKAGTTVRRGIRTILRGKPERLLWDDESARAAVLASKQGLV